MRSAFATVIGCVLGIASLNAHAAALDVYTDLTSFSANTGSLQTQDFESYSFGQNLAGVELLPGISTTTNMDNLEAFVSGGNTVMFGIGRGAIDPFYEISFTENYLEFAFEILGFEAEDGQLSRAAEDVPGTLAVNFADSTTQFLDLFGNLTGAPIFVGLVSDTFITSIVWNEAPQQGGGHEETSLDNFRIVTDSGNGNGSVDVPAPAVPWLMLAGLAGFALSRRRRPA